MPYITGDVIVGQFCTWNHSTGAAANADSTPSAKLVVNGVDSGNAVTITAIETGVYRWSVTCPSVLDGDCLKVRATYTVSSVAQKRIVWWGDGVTTNTSTISGQIASAEANRVIAHSELYELLEEVNDRVFLSGSFSNNNPTDGIMSIVRGASYDNVMNDKITFAVTDSADLDGGSYTATLYVTTKQNKALFNTTGTITNVTGNEYSIAFTVSATNSAKIPLGADAANYSMTLTGPTSSVATPHVGIVECLYDTTGKRA